MNPFTTLTEAWLIHGKPFPPFTFERSDSTKHFVKKEKIESIIIVNDKVYFKTDINPNGVDGDMVTVLRLEP